MCLGRYDNGAWFVWAFVWCKARSLGVWHRLASALAARLASLAVCVCVCV